MKFGVVVFPGSNCDRDMQNALVHDLKQESVMLWHKDSDLSHFSEEDCIVLPGGFSFGDYLRTGAIARFSPIMQSVIAFANKGGKVLGICNGFQILCESHLLPGALLRNANQQFTCKNTFVKDREGNLYKIPVAHGEGRYYAAEETLNEALEGAYHPESYYYQELPYIVIVVEEFGEPLRRARALGDDDDAPLFAHVRADEVHHFGDVALVADEQDRRGRRGRAPSN